MTKEDFIRDLEGLGYNQSSFAKYLDVTDRSVRNWASGMRPVPGPVIRVIGLLKLLKILKNTLGKD